MACDFSRVKYSFLLKEYRLDLIFDSKESIYDMSELSQSSNATLILLNFCSACCVLSTDVFESWDESIVTITVTDIPCNEVTGFAHWKTLGVGFMMNIYAATVS